MNWSTYWAPQRTWIDSSPSFKFIKYNTLSANLKKILALFTKSQKKRTINIVLILVVGAILEMFSIGLIVPLIGIMVNGSLKNTLFFNDSYYFIESLSSEELTIYGMLFLVCAYTLKSLYLGVSAFYQSNYIYDIQQSISSRLVKRYILAPYTFHLQNNPQTPQKALYND